MTNPLLLEDYYKKFILNINTLIPEGVYIINLDLLFKFDLLHFYPGITKKNSFLSSNFKIIESAEKITLYNSEFVIWLTPAREETSSQTHALIALNKEGQEPQLEAAFFASGIYNSSQIVMSVLEKFLIETQEIENMLSKLA